MPTDGKEAYEHTQQQFCLCANVNPKTLVFHNLGYVDVAISLYQTFTHLKREGVIATLTRFLVGLPMPIATLTVYIDLSSRAPIKPTYEAKILAEVDRIYSAIPHDQLAFQWQTAIKFACLEGVIWIPHFDDVHGGIINRLTRIGEHVPLVVEMGYHFCYGDARHQHFMEPKDTTNLISMTNETSKRVVRPINFLHMSVPQDRDDKAYYVPLANLEMH